MAFGDYIKLVCKGDPSVSIGNYVYSDMGFLKDWNGANASLYALDPDIVKGYSVVHSVTIGDANIGAFDFFLYNNTTRDYNSLHSSTEDTDWVSLIQDCINGLIVVDEKSRWYSNNKEIVRIDPSYDGTWYKLQLTYTDNSTTVIQGKAGTAPGVIFYTFASVVAGSSKFNISNTATATDANSIKDTKRIGVPIDHAPVYPGPYKAVTSGMALAGDYNIYNMYNPDTPHNWAKIYGEDVGLLELLLTGNAGQAGGVGTGSNIRISGQTFDINGETIDYTVGEHLCLSCSVETSTASTNTVNYGIIGAGHPVAHIKIYTMFSGSEYVISENYLAVKHSRRDSYNTPMYVDYCFSKKNGRLLLQYTVRSEETQRLSYYYFTHVITQDNIFKCKPLTKLMLSGNNFLLDPHREDDNDLNFILVEGDRTSNNTEWAGFWDYNLIYNGHNLNNEGAVGSWHTTWSGSETFSFSKDDHDTYITKSGTTYLHQSSSYLPTRISLATEDYSPDISCTDKVLSTDEGTVLASDYRIPAGSFYKFTSTIRGYQDSPMSIKLNAYGYMQLTSGLSGKTYGPIKLKMTKIEQFY